MEHDFFGIGLPLKVCCRIGGKLKKEAKAKRQVKRVVETCQRERERENVIDCFVSRDSSERRAVTKVNCVFLIFVLFFFGNIRFSVL